MYLTESKVETFNHVNFRCNILDEHLSFNYFLILLKIILVMLKCMLENLSWWVMIFQKFQTLLKVVDILTRCWSKFKALYFFMGSMIHEKVPT